MEELALDPEEVNMHYAQDAQLATLRDTQRAYAEQSSMGWSTRCMSVASEGEAKLDCTQ